MRAVSLRLFLAGSLACSLAYGQSAGDRSAAAPAGRSSNDAATMVERKAENKEAAVPAPPAPNSVVRIGSGDLLDIKVFNVPELTNELRVNSDGDVSLPLVGAVHLNGLTPAEAEKLIAARLVEGNFLRDPHVSVFVKEYVTQGISVLGEVTKPGIYPLLGARRLYDAISAAGGVTQRAGRVVSIAHRDKPDQPIVVDVQQDPAKSASGNVEIYPGDTIVVSRAGVVYVVGEVTRPGGFVMDNNEHLTVLQAVALAQGLTTLAKQNEARLIRKTPTGVQEIPVPLKKILQGGKDVSAQDIDMQADDILFIPTSGAKGVGKRTLEAILQTATGVAIYRR